MSFGYRSAVGRHGQALATLLATGREHLPTALGSHAGAEAMRLVLVPIVRLERALHECSTSGTCGDY